MTPDPLAWATYAAAAYGSHMGFAHRLRDPPFSNHLDANQGDLHLRNNYQSRGVYGSPLDLQ